jgi:hypothetical protein
MQHCIVCCVRRPRRLFSVSDSHPPIQRQTSDDCTNGRASGTEGSRHSGLLLDLMAGNDLHLAWDGEWTWITRC